MFSGRSPCLRVLSSDKRRLWEVGKSEGTLRYSSRSTSVVAQPPTSLPIIYIRSNSYGVRYIHTYSVTLSLGYGSGPAHISRCGWGVTECAVGRRLSKIWPLRPARTCPGDGARCSMHRHQIISRDALHLSALHLISAPSDQHTSLTEVLLITSVHHCFDRRCNL